MWKSDGRSSAVLAGGLTLCAVTFLSAPRGAFAQAPELGRAPWSRMSTLLEKTFLKVDVLTVEVCFDDATAAEFARIAAEGRLERALGDSIAGAALRGRNAGAVIEFLRDVSLRQFLDGIDEDQRKAVSSGLMADSVHRAIRSSLPVWFAFLERRGILEGDRIVYGLEPSAIRTTYIGRDGTVLLDQRDTGRERRNSVLATWFAPGSSFRQGLLRSLEREGPRAGRGAGRCDSA